MLPSVRRLAALVLALTAASASAQSPRPAPVPSADTTKATIPRTPDVEAAEAVGLAAALAAYGRRTGSAQALVTAAAILAENPAAVGRLPGDPDSTAGDGPAPLEPGALLDDADRLVGSAEAVRDQIAALRALPPGATKTEPSRGAARGPVRYTAAVAANGARRHTLAFDGRETATLILIGDGSSDLDYYLYDVNGALVASDEGPSDGATLFWYVPYRQRLTLRVRNRGARRNGYHIVTN